LVSVGEVEIDEAGEQGEYDNVQKEIANKPFTVFAFYVSLLYLSQFSFQPSGGKGTLLGSSRPVSPFSLRPSTLKAA